MRRFPLLAILVALVTSGAQPAPGRDGDAVATTPLARLLEGIPHRVVFVDPFALVAMDTGLSIYDLRNPSAPARVSHLYLPSPVFDVAVVGNLAYLANGESGLQVVNIADVTRPLVIGSLATAGTRAVEVVGSVAYLAEASDSVAAVYGVRTVNVGDPQNPQPLGFAALPNGALDLAVDGGIAYVGLGSERGLPHGLYTVDVSDPSSPAAIPGGVLATGKAVHQVVVAAGQAYLAAGFPSTGAVFITSASAAPALLASVPLNDGAVGLSLSGTTLYVAARSLGLLTLNVSDPLLPVMLDALPTGRETVGVASYPGFAFIAERSSIKRAAFTVADASFPSAVQVRGSVAFAEATATAAGPARGYFLQRDALWIADTSNPGSPLWLGSWRPSAGDFSSLALDGTLAAVAEAGVVHLVDVLDPALPVARGDATIEDGVAVKPVLAGSTLYVVNGHGFESFDVTNPGAPVSIARFAVPGWSADLAVDGTVGYLVSGDSLHVVDLSASLVPTQIGIVSVAGARFYGVAAVGSLAVATGHDATLYVFDVSQANAPALVSTLAGPGGFAVALAGDRAVVAAGRAGLLVVDLQVPAAPVLEGSFDTSGTALALSIEGQNVYLATNEAQHWAVRCETCVATCIDSWPLVVANSLRAVKVPGAADFSWQLASGTGSYNFHRTLAKSALPALHTDLATIVANTASLALTDSLGVATGAPAFYKVYPRASCSGASVNAP